MCVFVFGCTKGQVKKIKSNTNIPQKIISLSPAATEILFAIGAENQVAAVSDLSDYPEKALTLPKIGGFDGKTLSLEKIIAYEPDFVYLTDGMHNFLIEKLEQLNIPYYVSKTTSFEALKQEILDVAKITGHEGQGKKVVDKMLSSLPEIDANQNNATKVYYEIWNQPFMSAGKFSFINDVISLSGHKNIFEDLEESYPMVSEESIISRQPQIILIPSSSGVQADDVKNRSGWNSIPAVESEKIFVIDDNLFSRPGPRIVEAINLLSSF